jgi:hypothetical protein
VLDFVAWQWMQGLMERNYGKAGHKKWGLEMPKHDAFPFLLEGFP